MAVTHDQDGIALVGGKPWLLCLAAAFAGRAADAARQAGRFSPQASGLVSKQALRFGHNIQFPRLRSVTEKPATHYFVLRTAASVLAIRGCSGGSRPAGVDPWRGSIEGSGLML